MNCPDCKGESKVVKTIIGVDVRQRYRRCQSCGTCWVSEERNLRLRWGSVAGNQPATTGNSPATSPQPPPTTGNQPPTVGNGGGVGGGLPSDLDLFQDSADPISRSGSYSDRDPDLTRAKKQRTDDFSPDFLAFWSVYPRKVAKPLAWRSWTKQKPMLDDVLAALAWQRETSQWQDIEKVPHPSSYLNARRWEDEKPKNVVPSANGSVRSAKSEATVANLTGWLRKHGELP